MVLEQKQNDLYHFNPNFLPKYSNLHIIYSMASNLVTNNFLGRQEKDQLALFEHQCIIHQCTLFQQCDCCVWKRASMPGLVQPRQRWAPRTPGRTSHCGGFARHWKKKAVTVTDGYFHHQENKRKKQNPWEAEMSILVCLVKMTKSNNNMSVIYHVI